MSSRIRIRNGLDIPISGAPEQTAYPGPPIRHVALRYLPTSVTLQFNIVHQGRAWLSQSIAVRGEFYKPLSYAWKNPVSRI